MEIVLVIAVLLLAMGVFAGTLLVFPAMWQGSAANGSASRPALAGAAPLAAR
jgi:hypothetical protein